MRGHIRRGDTGLWMSEMSCWTIKWSLPAICALLDEGVNNEINL